MSYKCVVDFSKFTTEELTKLNKEFNLLQNSMFYNKYQCDTTQCIECPHRNGCFELEFISVNIVKALKHNKTYSKYIDKGGE